MHVLHIPSWYPSPDEPIGGSFIYETIRAIARHSPDDHHSVVTWCPKSHSLPLRQPRLALRNLLEYLIDRRETVSITANLSEYRFPVVMRNEAIFGRMAPRLTKTVLEELKLIERDLGPVDIIHAHVANPGAVIANQISLRRQLPFLVTEHSEFDWFINPAPRRKAFEAGKVAFARATVIVGVSRKHAQYLTNYSKAPEKIRVIPNVVDETIFYPPTTPTTPTNTGPVTFLTLARLVKGKGIEDLLQAIKVLKERGIAARFRIGGRGELGQAFKRLGDELGVSDRVDWLGLIPREQAGEEFRHCTAFVLPSHSESFGVVYAEAMACGVPAFGCRNGGAEDIIGHDVGRLVDVADVTALANCLQDFIEGRLQFDPATIRETYEQRFSQVQTAQTYHQLYREVLNLNVGCPK
jgi:glycosyltransferase involved in cell wall biosynthesis